MVPTWDLVILVFFAASLVYGFLMGREKILITLLGAYVGLVIANQWGASAFALLTGDATIFNDSVSGTLSVFTVKVVLFALVILVVALKGGLLSHAFAGGRGLMGMATQVAFSLLSAALIAGSVIDFLPAETKNQIVEGSSLVVGPLVTYYAWWLILPIVVMAVTGFQHDE